MQRSTKSKTESEYAESQKAAKVFIDKKEKVSQDNADKRARLKALRVAKVKSDAKA